MYEYIEGRPVARRPTSVVLDVHGVGYEIAVPLGADLRPSSPDAQAVRVWTHFVVREDAQELYGFPDPETRELFRLLLRVRGVGPGLALAVLSSLPGDQLLEAIANGDAASLTRVKGVGKKTAEQILLDLRDRAPRPSSGPRDEVVPQPPPAATVEDAVRALLSIGFTDKEAQKSVARAAERVGTADLEALVRAALRG